jgi:hypothetical protein
VSAQLTSAGRKLVRNASKVHAKLVADVPGAPAAIAGKLTLVR